MNDATGPTYPDLPPICDEAGYQTVLATVERIEQRARPEEAPLLRMLRRAAELYEQTMPAARVEAAAAARTLTIHACACGECTECQLRAELARRTEWADSQARRDSFRLQKGRERIAFVVRAAGLWKRIAKQLFSARLKAESDAAQALAEELQVAQREIRALEHALGAALVKAGAGTSDYARSQPSDACEIELWKSHAEGAWEDLEAARAEVQAWRDAWGPLGPQTPDEVKVYEEVARRVDNEVTCWREKRIGQLENKLALVGARLSVQRAVSRHWQSQFEGCFRELRLWVRGCGRKEREVVKLLVDVVDLELAQNVLRRERDNAEAEAEALKVKLAAAQDEADRANAALTREWSAQTVLRQELQASRAAHEACILERDDWHKLADDRARELCGFAPQTPMGKL